MKFDLYKLELTGFNRVSKTFIETIDAADDGDARWAAMQKHAGTKTDGIEFFKTFYRLHEHGEIVATENIKCSSDLAAKMSNLERSEMSKEERQAFNNN